MSLNRRQFAQQSLGGLLTYSLLQTLFVHDAFGAEMKLLAARWLKDLNDLSQDVKGAKLKQTDWQVKVDELKPMNNNGLGALFRRIFAK